MSPQLWYESIQPYFHGTYLLTDAGGAQSISQLKILAELMHRLNFGATEENKKCPYEVFDMIGGVGSGG